MPWPEGCSAVLWVVRAPPRPAPPHLALLDGDERAANARLVRREHAARHACAHALLRTALGDLLDSEPGNLCIRPGEHRRPALAGSSARRFPGIDFNLSSTPGFAACAVARNGRVGVDIQAPMPSVDPTGLAERLYSARERAWCGRSGTPDDAFYRIWTLKEAVSKVDGRGLGAPFRSLSIVPGRDGTLRTDLQALGDDRDWRIHSLDAEGVALAVALRGVSSGALALDHDLPAAPFDPVRVTRLEATPVS